MHSVLVPFPTQIEGWLLVLNSSPGVDTSERVPCLYTVFYDVPARVSCYPISTGQCSSTRVSRSQTVSSRMDSGASHGPHGHSTVYLV